MTDYIYHPVYVLPYYMQLMNANFVRWPENAPALFDGLEKIEKELDNAQLTQMLNSFWRASKVAAWIIGLYNKVELEDELINTLHKDRVHCEHLIFALAFLNTENSIGSIERYIQSETDFLKEKLDVIRFEKFSFAWAIAAIRWLDKLNNTNRLEKNLYVWDTFKKDIAVYENKWFKTEWIPVDETIIVFDNAMAIAKMYR